MASSPLAATAPLLESWINALLKTVFAVACVFYAVLAFDYFISFGRGQEGLWLQLFAGLVSREHALGTGSVHVEQAFAYREGFDFMLMHTTMGAIAMAIGPFQFSNRLRQRHVTLHRTAGKIYLATVILSMLAGLAYLATTELDGVFSGATFSVALVGLDLMVLATAWLALRAILKRDIPQHRTWMAFNFGLLLGTPVLRLLWVVFGWTFPGVPQTMTNLAITTFLLPLCVFGMLLWASAQRDPRPLRSALAEADTRPRAPYGVALTAAVGLTVLWAFGRFLLPADPSALWLPAERVAADAAAFAQAWPLALVYAACVSAALVMSRRAVIVALADGRCTRGFACACIAAAVAGGLLASAAGVSQPGGWPMLFYWWGLAVIWILVTGRALLATRRGEDRVARDWTLYAAAFAWLPLTTLPQMPLWQQLGAMDADEAALTAVTLSWIGHWLAVQLVISLRLDGARAQRAGASDRSVAA